MPELPDLTVYVERLQDLAGGRVLRRLRLLNPFLLRTALPPIGSVDGCRLVQVRRLGKRIVLALEGELFLVIHLMIAGRLLWKPARGQAAGAHRAGGLRVRQRPADPHRGGQDTARVAAPRRGRTGAGRARPRRHRPAGHRRPAFAEQLRSDNHTLKRALADPQLFSGIGNAYSDEILHRARLSPLALTRALDDAQVQRLHDAARAVLSEWTARLRAEAPAWPDKVTAFRPQMAVHGRYGQPCPDCGAPVQRIVYASNECNYCARCQTGGRLLADRALSRLLKENWPKHLDDLA